MKVLNRKFNALNRYNDDISLEDAIHTALLTLKEGFEGQMTEKTIEIGIIGNSTAPGVMNGDAEQKKEGDEDTAMRQTSTQEAESRVHGAAEGQAPTPIFRKLTEAEIKDYLSLS